MAAAETEAAAACGFAEAAGMAPAGGGRSGSSGNEAAAARGFAEAAGTARPAGASAGAMIAAKAEAASQRRQLALQVARPAPVVAADTAAAAEAGLVTRD